MLLGDTRAHCMIYMIKLGHKKVKVMCIGLVYSKRVPHLPQFIIHIGYPAILHTHVRLFNALLSNVSHTRESLSLSGAL